MVRTRTRTGRLVRFSMHTLRLRCVPAQQSCFYRFLRPMYPARARIAEPCNSPRVRPEPPTQPDFPASASSGIWCLNNHDTLRAQVDQNHHSARRPLWMSQISSITPTHGPSSCPPLGLCRTDPSTITTSIGAELSPPRIPRSSIQTKSMPSRACSRTDRSDNAYSHQIVDFFSSRLALYHHHHVPYTALRFPSRRVSEKPHCLTCSYPTPHTFSLKF